MKSKLDQTSQRLLVILKLDSRRLFERLKYRAPEYLTIFSLKRTREHFREVFYSRFETCRVEELLLCSEEVLVGLDQFYHSVEELRWYLGHTEDMPAKVEDKVYMRLKEIEVYYETLGLYINAELGINEGSEPREEVSAAELAVLNEAGPDSSFEDGPEFGKETQWESDNNESDES